MRNNDDLRAFSHFFDQVVEAINVGVIKWRINQLHAAASGDATSFGYLLGLLLDTFVLSGLGAAFLAACTWMLAVSRIELSKAYPFVAMTFVLVPLAASLFLSEGLTLRTLAGAALIVLGIAVSAS